MPCKHAALAAIYAQQMAEMDEPWRLWQYRTNDYDLWNKCGKHPEWKDEHEYRLIPKTIQIGAFSVPEPMREKPDMHDPYYVVDLSSEDGISEALWEDSGIENEWLRLGIIHLTRDNCIAHAKALFSFSEAGS